jgi:hypothetical protein
VIVPQTNENTVFALSIADQFGNNVNCYPGRNPSVEEMMAFFVLIPKSLIELTVDIMKS